MSTCKLSSCERFFVISCTPPANEGVVVKRKKGYISFLQEDNALAMATRLAKKTPGTRFYVVASLHGCFMPKEVTLQITSYFGA